MIELRGITKKYNNKFIFNNYSVKIPTGKIVAILGPSGSGKSTLLNLISGIELPDSGDILYDGVEFRKTLEKLSEFRKLHIGMVPQSFVLLNNETVRYNIMLPFQFMKKDRVKKVDAEMLTKKLDIYELIDSRVQNLSMGERQRVALIRAVITSPDIILADEPTSALDVENQNKVRDLFLQENLRGTSIIFTTHNTTWTKFADVVIKLNA